MHKRGEQFLLSFHARAFPIPGGNRDEVEEWGRDRRIFQGRQQPLELCDFPFPGLVEAGVASRSRVCFASPSPAASLDDEVKEHVRDENGEVFYDVGGVHIAAACRSIGRDGNSNPRVAGVAFTHTSVLRPYSYGLQCCSDTVAIPVRAWVLKLRREGKSGNDPAELSKLYEKI